MNKKYFPSIISNTCWGGMMTHFYGSEYVSPFTGSFVIGHQYLELVKRFIDGTLEFENAEIFSNQYSRFHELPIANQELEYPVIKLMGELEVHFPHYKLSQETVDKWNRRLYRFNPTNVIIKCSLSRLMTKDLMKEFCKLNTDIRRIAIVDDVMPYIKYESDTLKIIQSERLNNSIEVADEPLESLHNLNWNLFGYKYDRNKILKSLGWI